jgi:hypothetical protein
MPKTRTGIAIGWSQGQLEAVKAEVKADLDRARRPGDVHSRLHAALRRLVELEADDTDLGRLKRYVYAMSALVQHERTGGLKAKDVEGLVTLTYAILQTQGVRPRASRLASLYGDVHLIKSQIVRKDGDIWRAAWEQQTALQLAGDFPSGGVGFQLVAMGNRSLRLGHARLALAQFREAAATGLPDAARGRLVLGELQAAWLSGDAAAMASADAQAAAAAGGVTEEVAKEIAWNELVRRAVEIADARPLLAAVRHGQSHYDATYVIEACLWAMTLESREGLALMPSLAGMRRNETLKPKRLGGWYEAGVALQDAYDHGVPLPVRLRAIGRILERRHRQLTIDKELLILAAATRWLARSKATSLAVLTYTMYRAASRTLSDGRRDDALGVLGDLTARPWLSLYGFEEGVEPAQTQEKTA